MTEAAAPRVEPLPRSRALSVGPPLVWLIVVLVAISLPYWLLTSQFAVLWKSCTICEVPVWWRCMT